jgi:hypothetical protein
MSRRPAPKLGVVAQPLRGMLIGRSTSRGIFDVLTVLGRKESLGRIEDQAKGRTGQDGLQRSRDHGQRLLRR